MYKRICFLNLIFKCIGNIFISDKTGSCDYNEHGNVLFHVLSVKTTKGLWHTNPLIEMFTPSSGNSIYLLVTPIYKSRLIFTYYTKGRWIFDMVGIPVLINIDQLHWLYKQVWCFKVNG